MFGIKIVSKKEWDELNLTVLLQALAIERAVKALDVSGKKVAELCEAVVKDDGIHS